MKEFYKNNTITHNIMSFTGFKALVLFEFILQKPRSFEEISDYFLKHPYLKEKISIDTLRVYINSLERIGCKIIRGKKTEGSKYKIVKNPYDINPTENQIKSIIKIYKILYKSAEIEDFLPLITFLEKITANLDNDVLKASITKLSPLARVNRDILKALIMACKNGDEISIKYKSPSSGIKNIDLITQKIVLINNKLHLQGISSIYQSSANFLISRILEINSQKRAFVQSNEPILVECQISDTNFVLENDERFTDKNGIRILEIKAANMFFAKQRILSLGSRCKVLFPKYLRDDVVKTLKQMQEVYHAI